MAEKNIDVALESSVQSVLSIVSNNAKEASVQSIITKLNSSASANGMIFKVVHGNNTSAGTKTLLNVTGKGKFFGAIVADTVNLQNTGFKLVIEIDGTVVCNAVLDTTYGSATTVYQKYIMCGDPKGFSYTDHAGKLHFLANTVGGADGADIAPFSMGSEKQSLIHSNNIQGFVGFINEYLPFEKSLKITATFLYKTSSMKDANYYSVYYSLDD